MRLLKCARELFKEEEKLVEPEVDEQLIFVGDTHGDLDASEKVINNYLEPGNTIIFLGDYVDKAIGPDHDSKDNIDYLLEQKIRYPNNIYLLQGNHEGWRYLEMRPNDFWEDLKLRDKDKYAETLGDMPLAFSWKNLLALHGAVPGVKTLEEIKEIDYGSSQWRTITWGDFVPEDRDSYRPGGRKVFDRDYFERIMDRLDKNILIRAHQLDMPDRIYDGRCITLLTTNSHDEARRIAKIGSERPDQVEIEMI